MSKKFAGFTQQQTEILARKMGYNGPMDKFQEFVKSSPAHSQKFETYTNKARQAVEGPAFAEGGVVWSWGNQAGSSVDGSGGSGGSSGGGGGGGTTTPTTTTPSPLTTQATALTDTMINNPQQLMTPVQTEQMTVSQDELVDQNSGQVGANPNVTAATGGTGTTVAEPDAMQANLVEAATVTPGVDQALTGMQAAQGTVSQNAQVEAATALPSVNATVQGQLAQLMQQFEGGQTPAWAAGAIRTANAVMAARGLGASSMAGSAITQAAMESTLEIAIRDASTFSAFEMQNLNNRQQARLVNAQAFLQMDLANLDANQQMTMFKAQSRIQGLFSDQAAENASRQFNASSQNQVDQFFASLKTQVAQFNAAQTDAMKQFNAGQTNSVEMFNRQMADARDQFNAANRLIIDQSNAQWRRSVTTANNATVNEANRIDAQTASGMTMAGYNNLMQKERDFYTFAYESAENKLNRKHELALAKYQASANMKAGAGEAIGGLLAAGAGALIDKFF